MQNYYNNNFIKKFSNIFKKGRTNNYTHSYVTFNDNPCWMGRGYQQFADEAYRKNVVVYQAIKMIASNSASVPFRLFNDNKLDHEHHAYRLINHPNPLQNKTSFFENLISDYLISGNSYIQIILNENNNKVEELYILRPDRITITPGNGNLPKSYIYNNDNQENIFPVDQITGKSLIMHIKNYNPLDDWYGMSPIEAAAFAIDQHNNAAKWNQSLLQNSARPSGAIIVNDPNGGMNYLTEDQYQRLRNEVDNYYSGAANAGRPLLLQGGLEWKSMGLSPKDMDFIESKNAAAREIALAFGVPPQLLGIPGDNTYSNLAEARLSLWEQTIIPLLKNIIEIFNSNLLSFYPEKLKLSMNTDNINALALRKEKIWSRLEKTSFMTINEKREAVGLQPIENQ